MSSSVHTPKPLSPFGVERISDSTARLGYHFRIHDANDDRIATCYDEDHAVFIVEALNRAWPR